MTIARTRKWSLWTAALCGVNAGLIIGMYRWGFLGYVYDAVPALGRLMLWGLIGALAAAALALVRNLLVAAAERGSLDFIGRAIPRRRAARPRRRTLKLPWRRARTDGADDLSPSA